MCLRDCSTMISKLNTTSSGEGVSFKILFCRSDCWSYGIISSAAYDIISFVTFVTVFFSSQLHIFCNLSCPILYFFLAWLADILPRSPRNPSICSSVRYPLLFSILSLE